MNDNGIRIKHVKSYCSDEKAIAIVLIMFITITIFSLLHYVLIKVIITVKNLRMIAFINDNNNRL